MLLNMNTMHYPYRKSCVATGKKIPGCIFAGKLFEGFRAQDKEHTDCVSFDKSRCGCSLSPA
jgi:hypothetical protein